MQGVGRVSFWSSNMFAGNSGEKGKKKKIETGGWGGVGVDNALLGLGIVLSFFLKFLYGI